MPSVLHETLIEMFRHRPTPAAELLGGALGLEVPAFEQARLESADLGEVLPVERRADAVVVLSRKTEALLAVVVEAQLRPDEDKPWTWPEYLAIVRSRLRCPVMLLVVCVDDRTARWAGSGQP